jgi:DNA-binding transcriptional LysR family regulator
MNERYIRWDDLRIVLAIQRSGSLSAAGRTLSVSHATVYRRLEALEGRLGIRLFERARTGYAPTPAGEALSAAAKRMEEEVAEVERRVVTQDLRPFGSVRVTTTDAVLFGLLTSVCSAFRRGHPGIKLEVVVSDRLLNLSKREADIALRPTSTPQETLVGRKLGDIAQAVYARAGHPAAGEREPDLTAFDWVGSDSSLSCTPVEKWMSAEHLDDLAAYRIDTLLGMREAVGAGLGLAVLPCYLCDPDPRFARVGRPIPELRTELWLLTHPDLRSVTRIRAFMDFAGDAIAKQRALMAGRL